MLGRVRPSSSSLESLELERDEPFKITKHDSLSIYEATLVKLKQGAQRELASITEQERKTCTDSDSASDESREDVMMIDTYPSPCSVLPNHTNFSPLFSSSTESRNKTTVISMFDRYKNSHCSLRTPDQTMRGTTDQTFN